MKNAGELVRLSVATSEEEKGKGRAKRGEFEKNAEVIEGKEFQARTEK
jgi:hypothetical protein